MKLSWTQPVCEDDWFERDDRVPNRIRAEYRSEEECCYCGKPTCRGVVTGSDWREPALQEKYAGWFSPYLARRIAALPSNLS